MAVSFLMGLAALRERLQRLTHHEQAWDRAASLQLLAEADAGKATAIPLLFLLAFVPELTVAEQTVTAIARLTSHFKTSDWYLLETRMRSYAMVVPTGLPIVTTDNLPLLERFSARRVLLLGLASFQPNGYVREAAVKELRSLSDDGLPFLLMRLNDWVPQVSQVAHDTCTARLTPDHAVAYLACLPHVLALARARRRDFGSFIRSVEELLMRPECRSALRDALDSPNAVIRRNCFRLALSRTDNDAPETFSRAFQSADPIVRRQAAALLRERPAGDGIQLAFLSCLARDPLAAIRREYLFLCRENYPDRAGEALRDALLDSHPSVRAVARYYLPRYEPTNFRQFYLDALETEAPAVALAGLGEVGRPEDGVFVATYLHHPVTGVRQAAVTAIGRLDGDASLSLLLNALNDSSARVSRAAREALQSRVEQIDDEALWTVYQQATPAYAWKNALRLIFVLPKWRAGVFLVEAVVGNRSDTNEVRAKTAVEFLQRWLERFNGSFLRPTRQQLSRMRQAMEEGAAAFNPVTLARLHEILRNSEGLAT